MRLPLLVGAAGVAALALAASASAGLWIDLDRSVARPGQLVHGRAVSPCALCGPRPLYLVDFKHSGLQLLRTLPRKGDSRYLPVGRFNWKGGGRFSFLVPNVRPGVYQLHALYRNGSAWTLAPASTMLRVLAFSPRRVSFGIYSIVVSPGWHWRMVRGPEQSGPRIAQLSNASFHVRPGLDPIKDMDRRTFVLTILPLGEYGSPTPPTIKRADFLARSDPARPRGHALVRHSYCSPGGRCFSIEMEYGSERVPDAVLAAVNRVLRSLSAVPLRKISSAAARNPWRLHCPSMPTEQRMPAAVRAAALRFFPWVRPAARGLRSGPLYLVALSTKTSISRDGDDTDSSGYYLHSALVAVAPSYSETVTVIGRRIGAAGRRTILGFSSNGATSCTVNPPDVSCAPRRLRLAPALRVAPRAGWRIVPTELRIGRTGCFRLTATGLGLRETIPLAVPGPDYGTTGW